MYIVRKKQQKETLREIKGKPENLILGELKLRSLYLPQLNAEWRPILRSATNVTLPNKIIRAIKHFGFLRVIAAPIALIIPYF